MRTTCLTLLMVLFFAGASFAVPPVTAIYFDDLQVVHEAGGSTMLDDFENGTVPGGWWDPDGSGSTYGTYYADGETWSTNSTIWVSENAIVQAGSLSVMLQYQWAGWGDAGYIREYCTSTPQTTSVPMNDEFQVWIYGNNSYDKFRWCIDDGSAGSGYLVSDYITLNWTGWQLVTFKPSVDPVYGWITGNGILDGPDMSFDSFHIMHEFLVPLELSSFEAIAGQEMVELKWRVESERNNAGFRIIRDGDEIAYVEGQGDTESPRSYSWIDHDVTAGVTYTYQIASVALDGSVEMHDLTATATPTAATVPTSYALAQNYPNPFNADTQIEFSLAQAGYTTLKIYNTTGQLVRTLVDGHLDARVHKVRWDGRNSSNELVASGVYFYRLTSGTFAETRKMSFLR